jgi:hypothetical protein
MMTGLGFDVSLVVEVVLAVLLAATVAFCAILERRLRGLRHDQAALAQTVEALNNGIFRAQGTLMSLRNAATEASAALHANLGPARTLADELSLMIAAGERIAARIEAGRNAPAASPAPRAPRIIRSSSPQAGDDLRAMR